MGKLQETSRLIRATALLVVGFAAFTTPVHADDPNECDFGEVPDVIVGDLEGIEHYGQVDGITAIAIGTWSCNVGTCWLNWIDNTEDHPVITQNIYRQKDGRFEQIGQAWLKHAFFALSSELCTTGCIPVADGSHLGVNCADPYSAPLNGQQYQLGPKFEVDASTGEFPFPFTGIGVSGDAIYKRLQIHNEDLDPALNSGAAYFAESMYIAKDDAFARRDNNNAAWRPIAVTEEDGEYLFEFISYTRREEPAILAWSGLGLSVTHHIFDVPQDGRFYLGINVTDLHNGMWNYEYALFNYNSHRSAGSFRVQIPAGAIIENIGFHDVDYHSGEPYPPTDWAVTIDTGSSPHAIQWETEPYATNPDANALRWDTLYNFRFDINVPPSNGLVTVGLFRPGTPAEATLFVRTPTLCDGDESCEMGENPCTCPADCGLPPSLEFVCDDLQDDDCDGFIDCLDLDCCDEAVCDGDQDLYGVCEDCDDNDDQNWATPGEVPTLDLVENGPAGTSLSWLEPLEPGCTGPVYDVLRSENPDDWTSFFSCLPDGDPGDTELVDLDVPAADVCHYYLVRAKSDCPEGDGSLGFKWDLTPRIGAACP